MKSIPISVKMDADLLRFAKELGHGNMAQGVRTALIMAQTIKNTEKPKKVQPDIRIAHCTICNDENKIDARGIPISICSHFRSFDRDGFSFEEE